MNKIHEAHKAPPDDFGGIVSFYDTGNSSSFYFQTNVPLMIVLTSIHPDDKKNNICTTFSPDGIRNYCIEQAPAGYDINRMHQHNAFEFMYILKGYMHQVVEGKQYFYSAGSGCLLTPAVHRAPIYNETDFTAVFLSMSVDLVDRMLDYSRSFIFPQEKDVVNNLILRFLHRCREDESRDNREFLDFVPRISEDEQKKKVHSLIEQLVALFLDPQSGASFRLQELLSRFFSLLCDPKNYSATHVSARTGADSLLFARIAQLLKERNGRISNRELSTLLSYNGTYIGRVVKKNTGMSLYDYAMTFTMKAAAERLLQTDKSVAEIAEELSFSNRTHFYEKFAEVYHTTPARYRAEHGNISS